jgi:hypothetical protein
VDQEHGDDLYESYEPDDMPEDELPVVSAPTRSGRGIKTRLGVSVPGAIGGVLLVCALAFGASLTGSAGPTGSADAPAADVVPGAVEQPGEPGADEPGGDGPVADEPGADEPGADEPGADEPGADEPDADQPGADEPGADEPGADEPGADEPDATPKLPEEPDPTPADKPEPKPEPTPKPTPKPTEKPHLGLKLSIREGAVFVDWTSCEVPGADVYKVVRSTDSTVSSPMGENDHLVNATEVGGATKAWDEHARPGKRNWYRVFCLRASESGYKVVASSGVESIVAPAEPEPEPTPTPEPASMSIELGVEGGAIVIHWEACGSDSFSHYRILRKTDGEATLLAEVEGADDTTFVDETVDSGVEYHYLVQAKGHIGDAWVLLGTTGWAGIVAP